MRDLQRLERGEQLISNSRDKSVLHLSREHELLAFVNAYEQRVESACAWDISADDELLLHVHPMLDPPA